MKVAKTCLPEIDHISSGGGIGKLERKAEAESWNGKLKRKAESGNYRQYQSAHAHMQTNRLPRAAKWKEREK